MKRMQRTASKRQMPNEHDPSYAAWKATLETGFATLDDGAILVGHSVGATILVNALEGALLGRRNLGHPRGGGAKDPSHAASHSAGSRLRR